MEDGNGFLFLTSTKASTSAGADLLCQWNKASLGYALYLLETLFCKQFYRRCCASLVDFEDDFRSEPSLTRTITLFELLMVFCRKKQNNKNFNSHKFVLAINVHGCEDGFVPRFCGYCITDPHAYAVK